MRLKVTCELFCVSTTVATIDRALWDCPNAFGSSTNRSVEEIIGRKPVGARRESMSNIVTLKNCWRSSSSFGGLPVDSNRFSAGRSRRSQ